MQLSAPQSVKVWEPLAAIEQKILYTFYDSLSAKISLLIIFNFILKLSDEADDWDVDMEGYEVEGGGDRDNRSAMDMQYNDDVREGRVVTSAFKRKKKKEKSSTIGDFEKHTLGVGRKLV